MTKNFILTEKRLKINLYPYPHGNESQLKLKTNKPINDLKINFYCVDRKHHKTLKLGVVVPYEEKVLLLGKEITGNLLIVGIFLVLIMSQEHSDK